MVSATPNILRIIELYILKGWILWINHISIKTGFLKRLLINSFTSWCTNLTNIYWASPLGQGIINMKIKGPGFQEASAWEKKSLFTKEEMMKFRLKSFPGSNRDRELRGGKGWMFCSDGPECRAQPAIWRST